jgi:type I restriction enzyme M protein
VLFIDARKMGTLVDRTHRELTGDDIERIALTYHAWRGDADAGEYADHAGFCRSASVEEVAEHGHVLTPGRYVGAADAGDDDEAFEDRMLRLNSELRDQISRSRELDEAILLNLEMLGVGR